MKKLFPLTCMLALLAACEEEQQPANNVAQVDSAIRAQQQIKKAPEENRSKDTLKMATLPPVFEGDLVFQVSDDPEALALQKATGSKYSNVGMIFIRPRDHQYMVLDVGDSVHLVPLTEWTARGQGNHIAVMRLHDSNKIINEKRLTHLKQSVKNFRHLHEDLYWSWGDDAMYSSELMWKIYHASLKIDLCEPRTLGDFDLSSEPARTNMKKKYGKDIPKTDPAVSPDDLYHSEKLELIYER